MRWCEDAPADVDVVVYNKGADDPPGLRGRARVVPLANRGREGRTWLDHILRHYDELADWTYFAQGEPHQPPAEYLARLDVPYTDTTSLTREYLPDFPPDRMKALDLVADRDGFKIRYGRAVHQGGREPWHNEAWLRDLWPHFFACPAPEPLTEWIYAYCAMLAVPRHRITARPRAFWEFCHDTIARPEHQAEQTPGSGYAFELIWCYLFGDAARYPVRVPPAAPAVIASPAPPPSSGALGHATVEHAPNLLPLVAACPERGGVLPLSQQPDCGCTGKEVSECRALKGTIPGRVTLADCLACRGAAVAVSSYKPVPPIPAVIHQTWKDAYPPVIYRPEWARSWLDRNPGWDRRLWTDADLDDLTRRKLPEALPWFRSVRGVVRADFGRYLIMYAEGGFYADMDYECLRSFESFRAAGLFLSRDKEWINSALLGAAPGHPLFRDAALECTRRYHSGMDPSKIHETTAPKMFTEMTERHGIAPEFIHDEAPFSPIDWRTDGMIAFGMTPDACAAHRCRAIAAGAFSITYWTGLWGHDDRSRHATAQDQDQGSDTP